MARGFTEEECQSEGLFLLLAGSESTANAMRSILIHTISSPAVYNRLVAEIQDAVRTEKVSYPITLEQGKKLPYLQVCLIGIAPKRVDLPR